MYPFYLSLSVAGLAATVTSTSTTARRARARTVALAPTVVKTAFNVPVWRGGVETRVVLTSTTVRTNPAHVVRAWTRLTPTRASTVRKDGLASIARQTSTTARPTHARMEAPAKTPGGTSTSARVPLGTTHQA
jgi:hypothetical protein